MNSPISSRRTALSRIVAAGCSLWLPATLVGCDSKNAQMSRPIGSDSTPSQAAGTESADAASGLRHHAPDAPIDWPTVSRLRVVLGHQSVGANILNGVERLAARDGVKIAIQERRTGPALRGINHFRIGSNGDPLSKMRDFAAAVDSGAIQEADVALMKLCYVDFEPSTDAQRIADEYIASLESLARNHPKTRFVAVTAPLVAAQSGPKAAIKRVIGKVHSGYVENGRRMEFNARLRQRYSATDHLFDLARIESSGESYMSDVAQQEAEALRPELTSDGAHLNERGQELVARALLSYIGAIATPGNQVFWAES